jgi:hypothetical protein
VVSKRQLSGIRKIYKELFLIDANTLALFPECLIMDVNNEVRIQRIYRCQKRKNIFLKVKKCNAKNKVRREANCICLQFYLWY